MFRVAKKIASANECLRVLALAAIVILIGGCSTPVLEKRANVPPPTMSPDLTAAPPDAQPIENNTNVTTSKSSSLTEFPQVSSGEQKYIVKKGDSLWKIATMYGVSISELASYNNIDTKKTLKVGTVLNIPPGGNLSTKKIHHSTAHHKRSSTTKAKHLKASAASSSTTTTNSTAANSGTTNSNAEGTYIVKSGDSLWLIAKHFKTTSTKLADANGISKSTHLQIGQKLVIPKGGKTVAQTDENGQNISNEDNQMINELMDQKTDTTAPASTPAKTNSSSTVAPQSSTQPAASQDYLPHTVKDGDTWNTISEMYGVSVDSLKKANPKITSDDQLKSGIVINIPEE